MGLNEQDKLHIAETAGQGPIQDKISSLAKKHKLWIIAGTIPIKGREQEYVPALWFSMSRACR